MTERISRRILHALAVLGAALLLVSIAGAQSAEQVLINFNGHNGSLPFGKLMVDGKGRFYGSTLLGGSATPHSGGEVFEMIPKSGGGWNFHKIYAFQSGADGANPMGNMVMDAAGNIYGVLQMASQVNGGVFKLAQGASGVWTESVIALIDDTQPAEGSLVSGLAIDAAGNLYGTTRFGGSNALGSVYQLSPNTDGSWTQNLLYSFGTNAQDGTVPSGEVVLDTAGNIYGTNSTGGAFGFGAVFELSPAAGGGWNENVLYSFTNGTDQEQPTAQLLLNKDGDLFGTTPFGSGDKFGTAFKLKHNPDGSWTQKVIHVFGVAAGDGSLPESGLIADSDGNLYGTTALGGSGNRGTVYELSPGANGTWSERVLASLNVPGPSLGSPPELTFGPNHILYGVVAGGGTAGDGVLFQVKK